MTQKGQQCDVSGGFKDSEGGAGDAGAQGGARGCDVPGKMLGSAWGGCGSVLGTQLEKSGGGC